MGSKLKFADILTELFLRQRYVEERQSIDSIATETGIETATVNNYLRRYLIPRRTLAESRYTPVDYAGFNDLSNNWHAYWISFLAADGCVFADLLYRDCTVWLERKRIIFREMEDYHAAHPRTGSHLRY